MTGSPPPQRPPGPPSRRRHPLRALLITLVVLAALLVGADRGGHALAEHLAATSLQSSQHLEREPSVSIGGFPFLNQLATNHYDDVTVQAQDIPVGTSGQTITVDDLHVHLTDVDTNRDFSRIEVAHATATATFGYARLSRLVDAQVRYAGSGRIVARKSVTVAGVTVSGSVSVRLGTSADAIGFRDPQVRVNGTDLGPVDSALAAVFPDSLSLSGLPFQIRPVGIAATSAGLAVRLTGSGLTYTK